MTTTPLLLAVPDQIDTERLILRVARAGDGRLLNEAVLDTIDDLQRFPGSMPWAINVPTVDDSEAWCRASQAKFLLRTDIALLWWCRQTGRLAGSCGLHHIDWNVPKCRIGYWCRRDFQRRGFASEAVRALTALAFDALGMRRVELHCDDLNHGSRRVAERTGFVLEGVLRHDAIDPDGTLRDTRVYAQVRPGLQAPPVNACP